MTVRTETGHLPVEANAFIGRERDVTEVGELLKRTRLLTLAGPGGIGKSRLALRAATLTEAGDPAYVDGTPPPVYFAEMADLSGDELVVPRVAAAVGVTAEPGRSTEDTLIETVRARPMLLVLDNCEHLVEECARLCTALLTAAPEGLRLLATSREPLRVYGETVWRVPPMSLAARPETPIADETARGGGSEAVRLFIARAVSARPDFDAGPEAIEQIDELCRKLDGMPLAIELAAARVRVLSVPQITARLVDRFRLLASGDRTAPERQRTLRAAMDWSHDLLGEPERTLFRRLSVFSGGWTLEMAERVCADTGDDGELPEFEVLDRLADLVDKSLVTVVGETAGEMRYRMLESVREYAAARLKDAGERDALRDRHLGYMRDFAHMGYDAALGPDPRPWDEVLDLMHRTAVEKANAWAAMTWALETGDLESGMEVCHALTRGWWIPQGEFDDGAHWCDRFIEATEDTPGQARARILVGRAEIAYESEKYADAVEYARRGLRACRETGEETAVASALIIQAAAGLYVPDEDEDGDAKLTAATTTLGEALALAGDGGDRWSQTLAMGAQASIALLRGDGEGARSRFADALRIARDLGNNFVIGRMLLGLGVVADGAGDRDEAVRLFEEALHLLREDEAHPETVRGLLFLARTSIEAGDLATAGDRLREALRTSERLGHWRAVARCLEAAALLAERRGAPEDAASLIGAAENLREKLGMSPTGRTVQGLRERLIESLGEEAEPEMHERGKAMTPVEAIARALRVSPPVSVPRQAPEPASESGPGGPLTAREREIAALLARGLSNREVAAELVISQATVARHVANILTKLSFSSRAQVAAWAVRTGLTGEDAD